MIEILIAVIIQITTIINGADADKIKAEQKEADTKAKTEQPTSNSNADGGQGNWE